MGTDTLQHNAAAGLASNQHIIGWREWVALPELGVPALKAKIDTGARTSALHVTQLESFFENGRHQVRFVLHPLRKRPALAINCQAEVVDERLVSDSGGHREKRLVIRTPLRLGGVEWSIEMTLTNREDMLFRMLLGRTAMHRRLLVDPARSYQCGRELRKAYRRSPLRK